MKTATTLLPEVEEPTTATPGTPATVPALPSTLGDVVGPVPALRAPVEVAEFGFEEVTVAGEAWLVAVADTKPERFQGLRRVDDLLDLDGMLFVYDEEMERVFTMRTVPIPLEIGFFDGRGRLFEVLRMERCGDSTDCPTYRASAPFRWAVETEVGRWRGVPIGSTLTREN